MTGSNGRLADRSIHVLMFVLFGFILAVSHKFDWDYIYASFEADLQSWSLDFAAPIWNYSFCGGSPRIADPQAFGLSPFFIVILIFGPVLGAKLLYLGLSILGYFSLRSILCSLSRVDVRIASYLALYFVLGYYFIWHAYVGHVTFALMYLWLAVIALCVRLVQSNHLQIIYCLALVLAITSGLTAGSYHSIMFFLFPVSLVLAPVIMLSGSINIHRNGVVQTIAACLIALLLSSFRLIAMIQHQLNSPRLMLEKAAETTTVFETIIRLFLPTYKDTFLGFIIHKQKYDIWEYATFNWNHITILVCLFLVFRARNIANPRLCTGALVMIIAGLLLASGNFSDYAPFSLLNNYLFQDSLRVAGRFLIVTSLGLTLLQAALVPGLNARASQLFLNFQRTGIFAFILVPWAFYHGSQYTGMLSRYTYNPPIPPKLQAVIWLAADEANYPTTMYWATSQGGSVLNCYNPFKQERRVHHGGTDIWEQIPYDKAFHFVKVPAAIDRNLARQCQENSYYDSQRIHLDQACPVGTCIVMNGISPSDPVRAILELKDGLYCKVQTPTSDRPNE